MAWVSKIDPNWDRLKLRYKCVIGLPFMAAFVATWPGLFAASRLLGEWLRIDLDLPLKSQTNGILWLLCFLGLFVGIVVLEWFSWLFFLAIYLKRAGAVPSVFECVWSAKLPEHWFNDETEHST